MDHLTIEQGADGFRAHGRLLNLPWLRTMPSYEEIQEVIINELRFHAVKTGKIFTIQLNDINGESYWLNAAPNGQIDPQPVREGETLSPATSSAASPQHAAPAEDPSRVEQHSPTTSPGATGTSPTTKTAPHQATSITPSDTTPPASGAGQAETMQPLRPGNDREPQAPAAPPAQDAERNHGQAAKQSREQTQQAESHAEQAGASATDETQANKQAPTAETQPQANQVQQRTSQSQPHPGRQGNPSPQGAATQCVASPARRTREDLIQSQPQVPEPPASQGWRGFLRRASRSRINIAPGQAERAHREAVASVQRSLSGPKTIVVVNPKGGAHKTTATLMIAATFGMHRGGSTLAWDNNETQGTLGARALRAHHTNTAVELLRDLSRFNHVESARFGDLDNYVRSQGDARFDVLASDDNPSSPTIMSGDDFLAIHNTLSRFYRVMVIDTGNNPRASNWQAAVEVADQLVIVSTLRDDTATVAAGLADRLHSHGFQEKLAQSVTVLSEPGEKSDRELTNRLREHFTQVTRSVTIIPYEPAFIGGGVLNLATLRNTTLEAWLQASSQIAEGLNK